jgi:hypothetical protein
MRKRCAKIRPSAAAGAARRLQPAVEFAVFPSRYAHHGRLACSLLEKDAGVRPPPATISRLFVPFPSAFPFSLRDFFFWIYIFLDSNLLVLLPRGRHKTPQPPDRSAEHRIIGRRRGAARPRAGAALRPLHRPHGESLERRGLLERVRTQEELHDSDGGLLVGGCVVLGARGGVYTAPAHKGCRSSPR